MLSYRYLMRSLYCDYSESVKNAKEAALNLDQAKPAPKQPSLKGLVMQADPKFSGSPTPAGSCFLSSRSITSIESSTRMPPYPG
jgi:hypothetical protein